MVKLLDTILQSLGQMRNLSVVDESPDLAPAVEIRLLFTKARRLVASRFPLLLMLNLIAADAFTYHAAMPLSKNTWKH